MPIINNPFNGKMNLDVADYRIDNGDYIDAINITKDAQGVGQDRVISNILGNTYIPYTLPNGENKVIGFYPDKIRNRAYYFLYNTNGYNSIIYYNLSSNVVTKVIESKTDSDGVDILNFNPSYKVTSINIFYRDDEGDILFFNDGLNPPKSINVTENHRTSWKLEYLLIAKAPPVMPPKVVYENDDTVTINNLRNKLFQFSYRYVYLNNEKSVWSSNSIVPLPQQPSLPLTSTPETNNSRISIVFSTGGYDVRAVELAFRETTNGTTSDWYLIKSFNKSSLLIENNDVYYFRFYNDSIYTQLAILETTQLQDWVPQKANASELANGNVLLYSGITESYDKTVMDLSVSTSKDTTAQFFYDQAGLLFFATVNGADNGYGTIMNIYLYGTGTNTDGEVTTLNNAYGGYYINSFASNGNDLSASYITTGITSNFLVSTILTGISNALIAKGYTQVSLIGNKLVMSYSNGFVLTSTGFKTNTNLDSDNTRFGYAWNSGYQYAVQYFDAQGRTIGAQTSINAVINTPESDITSTIPVVNLSILNKPPLYATYYQVLRSNNTTYNKRLCWISQCAYESYQGNTSYWKGTTTTTTTSPTTSPRFIYIGLSNIQEYNISISSTVGIISYNYTAGDRIKFIRRYDVLNNQIVLPYQFDYEIVGIESSIINNYGQRIIGNFIKIVYPFNDISNDFKFDGDINFQHYEILLYNYSTNISSDQRFYYEFGKEYGIGNPGTNSRYHFGLTQLPNGGAIIPITNGDLFYRLRNVPYDDNYELISGGDIISNLGYYYITIKTPPNTGYVENDLYKIQTQIFGDADLPATPGTPVYTDVNQFFYNKSDSKTLKIRFIFNANVLNSSDVNYKSQFLVVICPSAGIRYSIELGVSGDAIDTIISVPPLAKVWLVVETTFDTSTLGQFTLNFSVVKEYTIGVIESSFSDNYNLITNSNGRPSVIDVNAKKTYFPTLIRFSGAYQVDTNINQLNNFKFENFDEYDRSFGDVIRLHVRDRYLKVYQKFKVGNVPILTQIVKDSANNPLQANTDTLINKIQYYAGDYGIGDAATSLAWNNFADYFVDNYRGVVCRLSQDGIVPISITNNTNAFFVPNLTEYRQELNNGVAPEGQTYMGNPCIYGVFDAYTNKYILALEEINRYAGDCNYNGGSAIIIIGTTTSTTSTTSTTTILQTTTTTTFPIHYAWLLATSPISGIFACAELTTATFYTSVDTLTNGVYLYTNPSLTKHAANQYYSDYINSWYIASTGAALSLESPCSA